MIQQNLIPNPLQLRDLLNLYKKDILLSFNCHHLGTIQSFDPTNQTATATINYKKVFFEFNTDLGVNNPVYVDYPILSQCPVICLGGGNAALTFPIEEGDECLVLFNDRDLDAWFSGGMGAPPSTARLHALSDGVILVGVRSLTNSLQQYDPTRTLLRSKDGSTCIGVNPSNSKLLLTNTYPSNSITLNTLLQSLITDLQNLISALSSNAAAFIPVTGSPGGPSPLSPVVVSALASVSTSLSMLSTQMSGVLE